MSHVRRNIYYFPSFLVFRGYVAVVKNSASCEISTRDTPLARGVFYLRNEIGIFFWDMNFQNLSNGRANCFEQWRHTPKFGRVIPVVPERRRLDLYGTGEAVPVVSDTPGVSSQHKISVII